MNEINKINIRVYGCVLKNNTLLALHEMYAGEKLLKLPGGGLEYGEGVLDCLHREFLEELNLKIKAVQHFYTQEDFLVSKFRKNEQLLTLYYTVELENDSEIVIKDRSIDRIEWIALDEDNPFVLPIDKIVFDRLKVEFGN